MNLNPIRELTIIIIIVVVVIFFVQEKKRSLSPCTNFIIFCAFALFNQIREEKEKTEREREGRQRTMHNENCG
jgi:L-asparagine transporter-like permease